MCSERIPYNCVIIMDTSGSQDAAAAVEMGAQSAFEGCVMQRNNICVEIIPIERIDDEVRLDNRLWNLILNAQSILIVTSFHRNDKCTEQMKRIMRISNAETFNDPRVSFLSVHAYLHHNESMSVGEYYMNGNDGLNQIRQWANRNNMKWVMDCNVHLNDTYIDRDYEHWKDICKLVGEGNVM